LKDAQSVSPSQQGVVRPAAAVGPLTPAANTSSARSATPTAGVYRLTVDDARQLALTNNSNLTLARINIEAKEHATAAARKDYLPKILANDTYFHFDKDLGTLVTIPTGRLGVLPVGARTLDVPIANQDSNLFTVMLAQPITKLIAVNAATQLARADENIARSQLDKGTKDLLSGVTQAYYGLLGAQRIQMALELQAKVLDEAMAAKPSPETHISLLELKQGLLQVRGQVQELTGELNGLLNLPAETTLELVDPLPLTPVVQSAEQAVQLAMRNNPEMREAEQNIAKAEAARQIARMDYLPDVNVVGGYANQTVSNAIQPNIGYLGVTASYTFWDWGKRGDVRRQRNAQIALAHQNLEVVREKVSLEARKSYGAFEQSQEAFRLSEEMVRARKDAEKSATTPAAIADAKIATGKAELGLMKAEIAYRVAHAQLAGLMGW
jgi:outer membrane protein TolC